MIKDYYFNAADDKYVDSLSSFLTDKKNRERPLSTYKYVRPSIFPKPVVFDKDAAPIVFQRTPDSLLNITAKVLDTFPLPNVYKWQIEEVCLWLRQYGYPQYQHTFRVNLVNGRNLLLLDASALSAMNIKNFDDIRRLSYGIRGLFYFEMTKFIRSISLAPEFHNELYKLFRTKSGRRYEITKRSDLWRSLQIMRKYNPREFSEHWEILERWLRFEPDPRSMERIGGVRRYKLFECKPAVAEPETVQRVFKPCKCMPPCECYWTKRDLRHPWELNVLPSKERRTFLKEESILSVLHKSFPERYGGGAGKYSLSNWRGFNEPI